MTVKKLIHGDLEDDFLPTFRLWREMGVGGKKKKKKSGSQKKKQVK